VAAGTECTPQNCGSCAVSGSTTACAQSCTAAADSQACGNVDICNGLGGSACIYDTGGASYCRQGCNTNSDCPAGFSCSTSGVYCRFSALFYAQACFPQ
jgi:Cys-rich repeat protein